MKVNIMELPGTKTGATDTLLLQVDNETLITVKDFGTIDYSWKVENCNPRNNEDYRPMELLEDIPGFIPSKHDGFILGIGSLGTAMVWVEPLTFAHIVMDLINNQ